MAPAAGTSGGTRSEIDRPTIQLQVERGSSLSIDRLHRTASSNVNLQTIDWCSPEYQQALELRHRLLREPLGLSFSSDDLDAEHRDVHFAAISAEQVVATLVASPWQENGRQLRQMVVDTDHQRQGIGTQLIQFAETTLAEQGVRGLMLHAREEAVPFYANLEYHVVGDPFQELGITHLEMQKRLEP